MEIPSLIFCRRTTGWHTGLRHTRFGRNPRKAAQGILSALRTGRANPTSWKCRNSSLWSFGRWSAGTGIFSNGTSGTGSLTRYGTKPFTDGRCVCLQWEVPRKSNGWAYGFGRANVWYASEEDSRLQDYLTRLVKQIDEYDGENWIDKYAE